MYGYLAWYHNNFDVNFDRLLESSRVSRACCAHFSPRKAGVVLQIDAAAVGSLYPSPELIITSAEKCSRDG